MDKSYQRGDIGKNGVVVKVTPAHWSKKGDLSESNTMSCWYKEDSKWSNRRGQTVVPLNVKKFKVRLSFSFFLHLNFFTFHKTFFNFYVFMETIIQELLFRFLILNIF